MADHSGSTFDSPGRRGSRGSRPDPADLRQLSDSPVSLRRIARLFAPHRATLAVVVVLIVLFLAGFAISPTLIAAISWVEAIVPADRLNEGMTVFTTGLVAGVAPGAALVGVVVDRAGASASFMVPAAAGAIGALVAFLTSDRLK